MSISNEKNRSVLNPSDAMEAVVAQVDTTSPLNYATIYILGILRDFSKSALPDFRHLLKHNIVYYIWTRGSLPFTRRLDLKKQEAGQICARSNSRKLGICRTSWSSVSCALHLVPKKDSRKWWIWARSLPNYKRRSFVVLGRNLTKGNVPPKQPFRHSHRCWRIIEKKVIQILAVSHQGDNGLSYTNYLECTGKKSRCYTKLWF